MSTFIVLWILLSIWVAVVLRFVPNLDIGLRNIALLSAGAGFVITTIIMAVILAIERVRLIWLIDFYGYGRIREKFNESLKRRANEVREVVEMQIILQKHGFDNFRRISDLRYAGYVKDTYDSTDKKLIQVIRSRERLFLKFYDQVSHISDYLELKMLGRRWDIYADPIEVKYPEPSAPKPLDKVS